jgi:hypothetical protein
VTFLVLEFAAFHAQSRDRVFRRLPQYRWIRAMQSPPDAEGNMEKKKKFASITPD